MVTAHRNEGIAPLDTQLKVEYPGIEIGWIGDLAHQARKSAHNPNKYGRINAIDPMIGKHFSYAQCNELVHTLAYYADKRINNIIFNHKIWDDAIGEWRTYNGDDPHTNHCHIEVHDEAHTDTRPWIIKYEPVKETTLKIYVELPTVGEGADDNKRDGYDMVRRIQRIAGISPADGVWGSQTTKALGYNVMNEERYRNLFGLSK